MQIQKYLTKRYFMNHVHRLKPLYPVPAASTSAPQKGFFYYERLLFSAKTILPLPVSGYHALNEKRLCRKNVCCTIIRNSV